MSTTLSRSVLSLGRRVLTATGRLTQYHLKPQQHLSSLAARSSMIPITSNQLKFNLRTFASNASNSADRKSEAEITEHLASEIEMEKSSAPGALPQLSGWKVLADGSDLTLTKTYKGEEITIKANVSYSVDSANPGAEEDGQGQGPSQMVCRPDFAIEIKKGASILGLNCSYLSEDEAVDEQGEKLEDDFQINEISVYEGEFEKNNYAITGDVIDGTLYDMLMNILEDRGVDQAFAKALVEYATVYEHSQYVRLLENLKKFFAN